MKSVWFIVLLILIVGCESNQSTKSYAVISHTRLNDNSGIDSIVALADLSKYDMLLLGGDMANLSSYNDSILGYLDDVFDVSNPKTLWAFGNHDYTNVELLKQYTQKETYYAYCRDKTVFIVLDTQQDSTKIINDQLDFFNNVMDTITYSKNVIVLTHKLLWMRNNPELESEISLVSNGELGDCSYCIQNNNFYEDIYPRLVEFEKKSGQVYCVAGDVGFNAKKFEYKSEENIQFLATGLKANEGVNYFLEIKNDVNSTLTFKFVETNNL